MAKKLWDYEQKEKVSPHQIHLFESWEDFIQSVPRHLTLVFQWNWHISNDPHTSSPDYTDDVFSLFHIQRTSKQIIEYKVFVKKENEPDIRSFLLPFFRYLFDLEDLFDFQRKG